MATHGCHNADCDHRNLDIVSMSQTGKWFEKTSYETKGDFLLFRPSHMLRFQMIEQDTQSMTMAGTLSMQGLGHYWCKAWHTVGARAGTLLVQGLGHCRCKDRDTVSARAGTLSVQGLGHCQCKDRDTVDGLVLCFT